MLTIFIILNRATILYTFSFSPVKCTKCKNEAIIFIRYNGTYLCERHFIEFFEKRVKKEIRKQGLPEGKIAVALSGGKDSSTACYIIWKIIGKHRNRELHAISVDEGIKGYRDRTVKIAKKLCNELSIPHHIISFKDEIGFTLDEISKKRGEQAECTYCGVFRRYCLNKKALEIDAKVIAMGHNLDDVSQTILMNFVRNDMERMARMAPHKKVQPGYVPRILPLIEIPEKETTLYALLNGLEISEDECPYAVRAMRGTYREIIMNLEARHPGTRHSILKSYYEIEPFLAKKYKPAKLKKCKVCSMPSSQEICMVCQLKEKLKKKI
ncbi:MAG: TIGR00269 family protein [Thermoplasmatales archaeon]|nr:TIGR00269 family protein [Thermoplasmatales archaeon]